MRLHFGCSCASPFSIPLNLSSFGRGRLSVKSEEQILPKMLETKVFPPILPPPPPTPSTADSNSENKGFVLSSTGSKDMWLNPQTLRYVLFARHLNVELDPDIIVALQTGSSILTPLKSFSRISFLPLCETLKTDTRLTELDFSQCVLGDSGAIVVGEALKYNQALVSINLTCNGVGIQGARSISQGLLYNTSMRSLNLRSNKRIGTEGVVSIGSALKEGASREFVLDISNCNLGFEGIEALMEVLRDATTLPELFVDGNFMKEEIFNSISHGFGVVLSIFAGAILLNQPEVHVRHFYAKLVYILSLACVYMASTFSHSFHTFKAAGTVFKVLDHCSIYLLIAGSYTPLCMITMGDTAVGNVLCTAQWICAFSGIFGHFVGLPSFVELSIYALMGWMVAPIINTFKSAIDPRGLQLIVIGGVIYTSGIYFFVTGKRKPFNHAVWHLFVLAASIAHYLAILWYVEPIVEASEN